MSSSQKVTVSIDESLNMQNWYILETAFHASHNNSQDQAFKFDSMLFDSDWEETLNDIDELIQSELGCTQVFHGGKQLFGQTEVQELSAHMQPMADASLTEWHFPEKPHDVDHCNLLMSLNPEEELGEDARDSEDSGVRDSGVGWTVTGYSIMN
ncbi:hypothetical protein ACROYT_G001553 [Oculina patagonica]